MNGLSLPTLPTYAKLTITFFLLLVGLTYLVGVANIYHKTKFTVQGAIENERGSVSLLQRKLEIGYSRAARIIDLMAEDGIVGEYKGSQARECLIKLEQWDAMQAEKGKT